MNDFELTVPDLYDIPNSNSNTEDSTPRILKNPLHCYFYSRLLNKHSEEERGKQMLLCQVTVNTLIRHLQNYSSIIYSIAR